MNYNFPFVSFISSLAGFVNLVVNWPLSPIDGLMLVGIVIAFRIEISVMSRYRSRLPRLPRRNMNVIEMLVFTSSGASIVSHAVQSYDNVVVSNRAGMSSALLSFLKEEVGDFHECLLTVKRSGNKSLNYFMSEVPGLDTDVSSRIYFAFKGSMKINWWNKRKLFQIIEELAFQAARIWPDDLCEARLPNLDNSRMKILLEWVADRLNGTNYSDFNPKV